MVGRVLSLWKGLFSGAMLVVGRVHLFHHHLWTTYGYLSLGGCGGAWETWTIHTEIKPCNLLGCPLYTLTETTSSHLPEFFSHPKRIQGIIFHPHPFSGASMLLLVFKEYYTPQN